jgi:hypothetical protein
MWWSSRTTARLFLIELETCVHHHRRVCVYDPFYSPSKRNAEHMDLFLASVHYISTGAILTASGQGYTSLILAERRGSPLEKPIGAIWAR